MSEKTDYRANLEQLNLFFPEKNLLNVADVSKFTGYDRRTVLKVFSSDFKIFGKSKVISKVTLARLIS